MIKYRIKKCVMVDGSIKYMPQEKHYSFWFNSLSYPKDSLEVTKNIIEVFKASNIVSTEILDEE